MILITAEIPFKTRSLNDFVRAHWSVYSKYKRRVENALSYLIGWGDKPTVKRYLKIETVRKILIKDEDNLRGGCKPIPDCFTKKRWIKDDSMEFLHVKYIQRKRAKGESEKTVITLSDIEFTE